MPDAKKQMAKHKGTKVTKGMTSGRSERAVGRAATDRGTGGARNAAGRRGGSR